MAIASADTAVRVYNATETIFHEGSLGSEFFVILQGAVAIRKRVSGKIQQLARLGPGEFFGEMAVVDRRPRSASAVAVEPDTSLIAIDAPHFTYLVSQQPGFAMLVLETLSIRKRGVALEASAQPAGAHSAKRLFEPVRIDEHCYQLRAHSRSSNAYVFMGGNKQILVDTGLPSSGTELLEALQEIGVTPSEIDLVILTHAHFDHIGAVPLFEGRPMVAAHPLAANKIHAQDEFATMQRAFGEPFTAFSVDWQLSEGSIIDVGRRRFRVIHTPGHSSGGISLIEQQDGLLISGDTVLAGGAIGGIFGSGNVSDMMYSLSALESMVPRLLLPGHGPISSDPVADIRLHSQTLRSAPVRQPESV